MMAPRFQTAPTDSSSVHLGLLVTPILMKTMIMRLVTVLGSKYNDEGEDIFCYYYFSSFFFFWEGVCVV